MLLQINQKILKVVIFILSLLPLFFIIYQIIASQLGPEPIKDITHHTGKWTLYFIIITLTMTPLKKITKLNIFFYPPVRRRIPTTLILEWRTTRGTLVKWTGHLQVIFFYREVLLSRQHVWTLE